MFRTPEVAQFFEEVRPWCHPKYPFLDPAYSPGATAPAVELTGAVTSWLKSGNMAAVQELWAILTPEGHSSSYLFKRISDARPPAWLGLAEEAVAEIRAIHILLHRMSLCGDQNDAAVVGPELVASTLANQVLNMDADREESFLRVIGNNLIEHSVLATRYSKYDGAKLALSWAHRPLEDAESAVVRLKLIPPMARLTVYDAIDRSWSQGKINFSLYYSHRMYGCSAAWNQHYAQWTEFFTAPADDVKPPAAVTKDALLSGLQELGIQLPKNSKRNDLISRAREEPGLISSLISRYSPEHQVLRTQHAASVKAWVPRLRMLQPVGASILSIMSDPRRNR